MGCGTAGAGGVKFTGQYRDQESCLDYFVNRYVSPAMGRFTSPDAPFVGQDSSDPQSWNLYSYTGNNPLTRVDPDGQDWIYDFNTGQFVSTIENGMEFNQGCVSNPWSCINMSGSLMTFDMGQIGPGSGNDPMAYNPFYTTDPGQYAPLNPPMGGGGNMGMGLAPTPTIAPPTPWFGIWIGFEIGWQIGGTPSPDPGRGTLNGRPPSMPQISSSPIPQISNDSRGNVGDTGIEEAAHERIRQDKAQGKKTDMCAALAALMAGAKDARTIERIKKTQKLYGCRGSRANR